MADFFEECVNRALADLPAELRDKMDNVGIIIEDFADPDTLPIARRRIAMEHIGSVYRPRR